MLFDELRSIAHNAADALASGYSLLVGMYELNVFGEAESSSERFIEVAFLAGMVTGGPVSPTLSQAIHRFRNVLPDLCRKHGAPETAFRQLRTRYSDSGFSATFVVNVEDTHGWIATHTYVGIPGAVPEPSITSCAFALRGHGPTSVPAANWP